MKAFLPALSALCLLAACDSNTAEAPPPGDTTPIVASGAQGKTLPGTVPPTTAAPGRTGAEPKGMKPGVAGAAAATPGKPGSGEWLWKGYKNPLATPAKKK